MSNAGVQPLANVTLAILAGGAGSRMGTAKGSLIIRGKPILEYLLDQIPWPGPTMLVTAPGREHPPGSQRFDQEVCDPPGGGGPLRGILTALEHCPTPLLVVMPVDMPEVRLAHLQFLGERLNGLHNCAGLVIRRGTSPGWRIEPFPSAYRRTAASMIQRRLSEGQASVKRLIETPGFETIDAPEQWTDLIWINLNSAADLARYCSR